MSQLQEKLKQLVTPITYLEASEWDDQLPSLLNEEGIQNQFVGPVLQVEGDDTEIAYIELHGQIWFVAHNWIPLFRLHSYRECVEMADSDGYYAIPYSDTKGDEQERLGREELEAIGFRTDTFEGF